MSDAVKFFLEHATKDERQAAELARAEYHATAEGWFGHWEQDASGADTWGDHAEWCAAAAAGDCQGHETLACVLRKGMGAGDDVLASLGGIIDPTPAYRRVVEAELALEALAESERPYCQPLAAGLHSSERAVANRLARLLNALDDEITGHVAEGRILDGVAVLRRTMLESLRAEGWRVDYVEERHRWRVRVPATPRRRVR